MNSRESARRIAPRLFVILLLLSLLGSQARAQDSLTLPRLHPGDAVRITVWRQPDLSGEYVIAEDGTISHPLLSQVNVVGISLEEVRERVRAYLSRLETEPQFVLEPLVRVAVGGEVRSPSLYRLPPSTTIAQAVAQAGGPTERGKVGEVRVSRQSSVIRVDLRRPDVGYAAQPVRSGDYIVVPRSASVYRDYVVPTASVTAALAAIINILIRL